MALPDFHGALWAWVQGLPAWQSDLLRRLATLDEVREDDLTSATRMVLGALGAADGSYEVVEPEPIPALGASSATSVAKLLGLRDLVRVGSTPQGQRLQFAPSGLTVVYGENGSGKSSYARILRKACRASAKPIEILPNVLKSGGASGQERAGTARIDVAQDGTETFIERDVNALPEPALAHISFFDSDCASVYADEESDITYVPSGLRLLERLVALQTQIKKKIDDEVVSLDALRVATDEFDTSTKAGALVANLSGNVKPEIVTALATVSDAERNHLDALRQRVREATANDPMKVAQTYERNASAAEQLVARVSCPCGTRAWRHFLIAGRRDQPTLELVASALLR